MTWTLPEPMLTTPVASPDLPLGAAAEPKWDGYRAQLARYADGRVLLRSRQGTDMTAAFPEIADAAPAQLPGDTGLDGELVVWEGERLAFERLQQRLARRRGAGALAAARTWPAHLVVFDVLRLEGTDLALWPYARRRTVLETLFTDTPLTAPFTLCPSTTDPATARDWLTWTSAGLEGLCFKRLLEPYRGGARTWGKYKVRATEDVALFMRTGSTSTRVWEALSRWRRSGMFTSFDGARVRRGRLVRRVVSPGLAPRRASRRRSPGRPAGGAARFRADGAGGVRRGSRRGVRRPRRTGPGASRGRRRPW
ncbi:hypothetical protein RKD44_007788 [Streptomyces collinus]